MKIEMHYDTDVCVGERNVAISLRGDPIVVKSLQDLISDFMKKQENPVWVPR